MKKFQFGKILSMLAIIAISAFSFTACTTVDAGHRGVKLNLGAETDMTKVYDEGFYFGVHWIWNGMVEYDCREQTMAVAEEFLDYDGLDTDVEAILYYRPYGNKANNLHKEVGEDFREEKLFGVFKAAVKNQVARHQALKLNREERTIAEAGITENLTPDLEQMHIEFVRVQITDVDLPTKISNMIIAAKEQDERNVLAEKLEREKKARANAEIARAKGEYEAATFDAKTKEIMSRPAMLDLKRIENETLMWDGFNKHGVSPYGDNNVFGAGTMVVKGLQGK